MIRVEKDGAWMEIDPLGAQMKAYQSKDGRQWLWSGDNAVWGKVSPILFPVIGKLRNDVVRIGGKDYPVPKHGFAQRKLFQALEAGSDFCTLVLQDTPETREIYPFAFTFTVKHQLLPKGFVTKLTVENKGKKPMPFMLGGHPAFACPMAEGEQFSDYQVRFEKEEEGKSLVCMPEGLINDAEVIDLGPDHRTLSLDYSVFDQKDTLIFAGLASRSVDLVHKETGKGLRLAFPQSTTLALWTMPHRHAPYLCLEPWVGLPSFANETGDFEDKPCHITLEAVKQYTLEYGMEIIA